MWQMVFTYVLVQGWIIASYVESLFYCSFDVMIFSPHYAKIVNCDIIWNNLYNPKDKLQHLQVSKIVGHTFSHTPFWYNNIGKTFSSDQKKSWQRSDKSLSS